MEFLKEALCASGSITEHNRECFIRARVLSLAPEGNVFAQWPCFCGLFCLLIGSAVELVALISFVLCLNTACQMCKDSFAL